MYVNLAALRDRLLRFRNRTFDGCLEGRLCYGVPLPEEATEPVDAAAGKLAEALGTPAWLGGVGAVLQPDGRTLAIEVHVAAGHPVPRGLPSHVDGFPVVVRRGPRAIPQGGI